MGGGNLLFGSSCESRVKPFGLLSLQTPTHLAILISIVKYDNVEGKKYLASFLTTNTMMWLFIFSFQTCGGSEKKVSFGEGRRAWLEHWTGILIIITVGSSGHHSLFSVGGKKYMVAEGVINRGRVSEEQAKKLKVHVGGPDDFFHQTRPFGRLFTLILS